LITMVKVFLLFTLYKVNLTKTAYLGLPISNSP
jgi:hypothetical protein